MHVLLMVLPQLLLSSKDCATSKAAMVVIQSVLPPIIQVKEVLMANRAGYVLSNHVVNEPIKRVGGQPYRKCCSLCLHSMHKSARLPKFV